MASTYANLQVFMDSCPQSDPYTPVIRRDFQITRDQVAVGDIPCTEPFTQMSPAQITDELSVIQTLRFVYHMDMGRSGYLPWTQLRLYDWMKSRVAGIDIATGMAGGECCQVIGGRKYISVGSLAAIAAGDKTSVAYQAQYRQTPNGQAANVAFFAHEARHTEGNSYPHVAGCPAFPSGTVYGCDQTYDETNLAPYAIQFYLTKQMLTGGINLGYSCDSAMQAALGTALQVDANSFLGRFVSNAPASLVLPAVPGGACIPAATFTLSGSSSQTVAPGANFTLAVASTNSQAGWTAASALSWITPATGANSVGSGQAGFSVSANLSGLAQPGSVVVGGVPVTVNCTTACAVSAATAITFAAVSSVTVGTAPFTVTATASSGLPVTLTSTPPAVCTVSGSTVTIAGTGTCSLTASQTGNGIYAAATPVTRSFQVTGRTPQTISFSPLKSVALGTAPFTISSTASSGLAVALTSTTPAVCTVSGTTVTAVSVGSCSIAASQSGNATYAAAVPVVQSFPVLGASQAVWTLNATFADGDSATGFFTVGPDGKTFSNWDVSVTAGDTTVFAPFEFTPANSSLGLNPVDSSGLTMTFQSFAWFPNPPRGALNHLVFSATLSSPLPAGRGIVNLTPGPGPAGTTSEECLDCYPARYVTGGAVISGYQAPWIATGGVVPVYSAVNTIQPGEWVSIFGTNLAVSTAAWNGDYPTSLGGTSVTINGKPAYLWFVSPNQVNLQAPSDAATGEVPVVITTPNGTFNSTVKLAQSAPSFLLLDDKHVTGIIIRQDGSGAYGGGTYDIIGPTGNSLGYPTVAAKAGDVLELFAVGFGPTNPVVPAGQAFSGSAPVTSVVWIYINNKAYVTPSYSGLTGAGLYQINLKVPAGLGTGDVPLTALVGGVQTPTGVVISLQ